MDDFDFLKAFSGVDLLQVEAVSKVIGRVVGKLREGMIESGMQNWEADTLLVQAWGTLLTSMATIYGPGQQGEQP